MASQLVDESDEVSGRATLDIKVDTTWRISGRERPGKMPWDVPIQDDISKRPVFPLSPEERVVYHLPELLGFTIRRQDDGAASAANGDRDDLACSVAGLHGADELCTTLEAVLVAIVLDIVARKL